MIEAFFWPTVFIFQLMHVIIDLYPDFIKTIIVGFFVEAFAFIFIHIILSYRIKFRTFSSNLPKSLWNFSDLSKSKSNFVSNNPTTIA